MNLLPELFLSNYYIHGHGLWGLRNMIPHVLITDTFDKRSYGEFGMPVVKTVTPSEDM